MAKQVTLPQLQATSERMKSYVDNHATANVIKTETILYGATGGWIGIKQNDVSGVASPVVKDWTGSWGESTNKYRSLWGTTGTFNRVTLSESALDFDELEIDIAVASAASGTNHYFGYETVRYPIKQMVTDGYHGNGAALASSPIYTYSPDISLAYGLVSNTVLAFCYYMPKRNYSTADVDDCITAIAQVRGVKYSHPVEYTTTEKVIGTYLGKTLYEKTLTNINVPAATTTVPTQVVVLNAYGIEDTWTVVKAEGIVRLANNADIMVPFCNPLNAIPDAVWVSRQSSTGRWVLASCCQQTGVAKALTLRYVKEQL